MTAMSGKPRWPEYFALLLTLTVAGLTVCYPMFDHDVYWHLANGREMVNSGHIVNQEIFSYTKTGIPFDNHEWLSQILWYEIYERWGGIGLNVYKILMTLAIVGLLFRTCRMQGADPYLSAILCSGAVLAGIYRYTVRPELFSLFFVALVTHTLISYRNGKLSKPWLFVLPVSMVIWDWLHGAIYGVVLLAAFTSGELGKILLQSRVFKYQCLSIMSADRIKPFAAILCIVAACMLMNPYGLVTYGTFFEFIGDNPLVKVVLEFQPPDFENFIPFWIVLFTTAAVVIVGRRFVDLTDLALLIPFAYLSVRYSRATGVFGLIAVPIVAGLLPKIYERLSPANIRKVVYISAMVSAGMATIGYIGYVKFFAPPSQTSFGLGVDYAGLPRGSVRFVEENNLQGNMYNTGSFGGYLAYFLYPKKRIFQYNHHVVFGDTLHYLKNPEELERWNINYAIVFYGDEIPALFPRDRWAAVYIEESVAVMLRRTSTNQSFIEKYEIRYFDPHQLTAEKLGALALNPSRYTRVVWEISNYLAFREDDAMATELARLLSSPLREKLNADHWELATRATRYNKNNVALRYAIDARN